MEEPSSPTPEELVERLHTLLREKAARVERAVGSKVDWNDDVLCDMAMLYEGRFVPGSIASSTWLEARSLQHLPGFTETLVGTPIGSARTFDLTIGPDYPFEEWRGKTVKVLIEVHRAMAVEVPELDDSAALIAAGLGNDIEEAMASVARLLDTELGERMLTDAAEIALSKAAERVRVEIPADLIDRELETAWRRTEYPLLRTKGFGSEVEELARLDYLSHPEHRKQATHRLKRAVAIAKLVESHRIEPSQETVRNLLGQTSAALEVSTQEALAQLDDEQRRELVEAALLLEVTEFIIEQSNITVVSSP